MQFSQIKKRFREVNQHPISLTQGKDCIKAFLEDMSKSPTAG